MQSAPARSAGALAPGAAGGLGLWRVLGTGVDTKWGALGIRVHRDGFSGGWPSNVLPPEKAARAFCSRGLGWRLWHPLPPAAPSPGLEGCDDGAGARRVNGIAWALREREGTANGREPAPAPLGSGPLPSQAGAGLLAGRRRGASGGMLLPGVQ